MINNFYTQTPSKVENCHGGAGTINVVEIFDKFTTGVKHFHYTVLPPNTSIGEHTHGNDEEFYVVIDGTGEMLDDGKTYTVTAGDVIMNKPFGTHGLKNTSVTDELKLLVFEV